MPAAGSKALRALRDLKKVYREMDEVIEGLRGARKKRAQEIRAMVWAGKLTPTEALEKIRELARS